MILGFLGWQLAIQLGDSPRKCKWFQSIIPNIYMWLINVGKQDKIIWNDDLISILMSMSCRLRHVDLLLKSYQTWFLKDRTFITERLPLHIQYSMSTTSFITMGYTQKILYMHNRNTLEQSQWQHHEYAVCIGSMDSWMQKGQHVWQPNANPTSSLHFLIIFWIVNRVHLETKCTHTIPQDYWIVLRIF